MNSPYKDKPEPFFKGHKELIVVDKKDFLGLHLGYECKVWRYEEFAEYLFDWVMEFATAFSDLGKLNVSNCRKLIKDAAERVYTTDNYGSRGEFGELMLHAILRELFDTEPAVCKLFYKSAQNDPVKGFDAVHVRKGDDGVELWLGEVKFYDNIHSAINSVIGEIKQHLSGGKLRQEFACVGKLIDAEWEFAESVKALMSRRTSLDKIFQAICVPVLLTYDSKIVHAAKEISDKFLADLKKELETHEKDFRGKLSNCPVKVHLILLPLSSKQLLIDELEKKLKGMQL